MKRVISAMLALVLCLLVLTPVQAAAQSLNPVPEAKQGVVFIASGIYFSNGRLQTYDSRGYYSSGTGFAVGEEGKNTDTFVTNCHVVSDSSGDPYEFVYICIDGAEISDESTLIKCDVIYTDSKIDVAVIQADAPVAGVPALPLLSATQMETGERVYALGFPGIANEVADTDDYTVEGVTVTDGVLSRYLTSGGVKCMAHTADVNHGNSGGPLINEYGHVIGINTFIYVESETADLRSYAIYVDYAMEALDKLGIHYDVATKSSGSTTTPKVTEADEPEETEEPKNDYDYDDYDHSDDCDDDTCEGECLDEEELAWYEWYKNVSAATWWYIGGGVALAAIAAAVIILVLRKRRKVGYIVSGVAGPVRGMNWKLSGRLTVGRDPSCAIVLPANTNGVSRQHCCIELQGSSVVLTDLGSAYGTYLLGRKLEANRPVNLPLDTEIYIGSDRVALVVRRK